MPVIEQLKPLLKSLGESSGSGDERPPAEQRAALHAMIESSFNALVAPHDPLPMEADHTVSVAGGSIRVRVYRPTQSMSPLPCYVYLHGGGFWLGTIDHGDPGARAAADKADCVVVAVDYRLAPEHKYPIPAEDCYAALVWVAEHAAELGVDPARIAVGGASAGGNLAAVVSLMARDRGGPPIVLQILEVPVTDMTNIDDLKIADEDMVIPIGKAQYRAYYLNNLSEADQAYASPLLAPDLTGLPPALVTTAEYDGLRPEGEAYAMRLREFGIPTEYHCGKGQIHGSQNLAALIPQEADAYQALIISALKEAFATAS